MSNNIEGHNHRPSYDTSTILDDLANRTSKENLPTVSASENVDTQTETQITFNDLKNSFEGLREGPNLNHELQMLISTLISSIVAETQPQEAPQNTSTESRSGGVDAVESTGPANNQGAMRKLQQVLSSDSRFIQQMMDYLSLSSPARKDEHMQNMGLEYKQLPPTLSGYHSKRQELLDITKAHFEGRIDTSTFRQQVQPLISYIDPAIMVIDNSLKMEEARLAHESRIRK
ncbi:hypothetical protein [Endozoicomonas sp. Mp262]|uniref:hypothetical protein n=1 Tax=Endozoicomonas sp. Mp262 TaxID=2919499 RepID=UPI0021D93188